MSKQRADGSYRAGEARRIKKACHNMLNALPDDDLTRQESMNLWVINLLLFNMMRRRSGKVVNSAEWPARWELVQLDSPGEQPGA